MFKEEAKYGGPEASCGPAGVLWTCLCLYPGLISNNIQLTNTTTQIHKHRNVSVYIQLFQICIRFLYNTFSLSPSGPVSVYIRVISNNIKITGNALTSKIQNKQSSKLNNTYLRVIHNVYVRIQYEYVNIHYEFDTRIKMHYCHTFDFHFQQHSSVY